MSDAYIIMQSEVGLLSLDDAQIELADVNKDGSIDVSDALSILKTLV